MHRHPIRASATLFLALILLVACGGGGDGGGGSGGPYLWVSIDTPHSLSVQTASIDLLGSATCDDCPPSESAFGYCPTIQPPRPSAIDVTWSNRTTVASGDTRHMITGSCSCLFSQCFTVYRNVWAATVPLAIGDNVIEVRASAAARASGTDSITITRLPGAIEGLTAVSGKGQVTLTWDPVPGATSYNLYWSTSRDINRATGTMIPGVSSPYTHTGLSDGVPYYYIIAAVINGIEALPSTVVWATPGWFVDTVAATTATTEVRDTSIATDSVGKAHIHYSYDEHIGTSAFQYNYYATNVTGAWASVLVDRPLYVNADIALDLHNTPHVSFLDFPGLTHAIYVSGTWMPEVADSTGQCDAALALDSADKAHIAYLGLNGLRYATNVSGSWASAEVNTGGSFVCRGPGSVSLGVDLAGAAHIAYSGGFPDYGLKYATNRGGAWTVSIIWPSPIDRVSLAVDPNGAVHIVYTDNLTNLWYAHYVSGTWTSEAIEAAGFSYYPSLGLDAAGKAHVSYYYDRYGELRYATNSTGTWHSVPIDAVGTAHGNSGANTDIAVDSQGKAHVSYFRSSGSLQYATNK